jgi:hypothetical protein
MSRLRVIGTKIVCEFEISLEIWERPFLHTVFRGKKSVSGHKLLEPCVIHPGDICVMPMENGSKMR